MNNEVNRAQRAKNTTNNSRVMHMAHKLLESFPGLSWSEILKLAWQFYYLRRMLQSGIVKFTYLKISIGVVLGEIRHARGTLHPELIPAEHQPKNSPNYEPNYSTISYYDLDKLGWRSFRLDCLRDIEGYITLNNVELNDEE